MPEIERCSGKARTDDRVQQSRHGASATAMCNLYAFLILRGSGAGEVEILILRHRMSLY